jgi:hypothetical protein
MNHFWVGHRSTGTVSYNQGSVLVSFSPSCYFWSGLAIGLIIGAIAILVVGSLVLSRLCSSWPGEEPPA